MRIQRLKVSLICLTSILALASSAETLSPKVASDLVTGKFKQALKAMNSGATAPSYLKNDVATLLGLNKLVAQKYAEKIGQKVDFYARKRLKHGTLLKVEKGVIHVKVTSGKASAKWPVKISSLPLGFRIGMAGISDSAKNLYMGVRSLKSKDFSAAKVCFANLPEVSEAMINAANEKYGKIYSMTKAAFSGDADTLKKLITEGSDPNAVLVSYMRSKRTKKLEKRKSTLLLETIKRRQAETAATLIENGAAPDKADSKGITPLMYAVTYFPKDTTVAKALIAKNANIAALDKTGSDALSGAIAFNRLPAFKLLLRCGAKLNAPNGRGLTPLMGAVGTNNFAMFTILMDKGADPSVMHIQGWTILDMNRSRMHPEIKARLDRIAPQKKKRPSSPGFNVIQRK